jgi:GNAT superfamily N-acetyltransferase
MKVESLLSLFIGLHVICPIIFCTESLKKMNNQRIPVVLEWHKTNIVSPEFAEDMKTAWSFARDAYIPVEMDFLKAFPEVVGKEHYFAPFEFLFAKGVDQVDWSEAEKTMEAVLKGHFVFDPSQFSKQVIEMFAQDTVFFVAIKEQATREMLGFITFLMRSNYPKGSVKVMSFAVNVDYQKRGFGKLLMSSIFNIVPGIKRIFLCTRVTNTTALNAYRSWGFVIDENPVMDHAFDLNHWTFMEYKAEQCDILQKTAQTSVEIIKK